MIWPFSPFSRGLRPQNMGYPQFVDAVCLTAMTIYNHPRYKEQGMTVEDMLETFFSQLCAVKRARWDRAGQGEGNRQRRVRRLPHVCLFLVIGRMAVRRQNRPGGAAGQRAGAQRMEGKPAVRRREGHVGQVGQGRGKDTSEAHRYPVRALARSGRP